MAIDPGSANIGISVFEDEELVYCARLNLTSKQDTFNGKINDILNQFWIELLRIAHKFSVDHVSWELVPAKGGFGSHDKVVAISALPKVLAYHFELPWQGIAAITAKKVMTGNAKATKEEVRNRVYELYPHFKEAFPDIKYNHWDAFDSVIIGRTTMLKKLWTTPKPNIHTGWEL
jgi:Holliday junction resolvasome RuvABC endonuclease subunit